MSKQSNTAKTAGKIFAVLCAIILAAVFAVSVYLGGMKRAAEKYIGSFASGSYTDFSKTAFSIKSIISVDEASFKDICRSYFSELEQFSKLEKTDIIASKTEIKAYNAIDPLSMWECTADIDFYCDGMSITFEDVPINAQYADGKWTVYSETINSEILN